jgi:hypothetical protein
LETVVVTLAFWHFSVHDAATSCHPLQITRPDLPLTFPSTQSQDDTSTVTNHSDGPCDPQSLHGQTPHRACTSQSRSHDEDGQEIPLALSHEIHPTSGTDLCTQHFKPLHTTHERRQQHKPTTPKLRTFAPPIDRRTRAPGITHTSHTYTYCHQVQTLSPAPSACSRDSTTKETLLDAVTTSIAAATPEAASADIVMIDEQYERAQTRSNNRVGRMKRASVFGCGQATTVFLCWVSRK